MGVDFLKTDTLDINCHIVPSIPDTLLPAPDQESPDNILNRLPVHCLRTIFELSISHIMDLVEIANVCLQFNAVAIQIFKTEFHKSMSTDIDEWGDLLLWQYEEIFRTFGSSVTCTGSWLSETESGLVQKYCPIIKEHNYDSSQPQMVRELRTFFSRLEVLFIRCSEDTSDLGDTFVGDMQLKKLHIFSDRFAKVMLPNRNFIHLIELDLSGVKLNLIEPFYQANQQLQVVKLGDVRIDIDINVIIDSLPNLTTLDLSDIRGLSNSANYNCNVQHTQLRTL